MQNTQQQRQLLAKLQETRPVATSVGGPAYYDNESIDDTISEEKIDQDNSETEPEDEGSDYEPEESADESE
jgi:hypothetical protein